MIRVLLADDHKIFRDGIRSILEKERDIQRTFPIGADVEVVVLEVDSAGRRIRLSAKAVMEEREAEEVREWAERETPAGSSGLLADKLRAAFKAREK